MNQPKRVGDLEVHADVSHQEVEWRAERVGWIVMALLMVAALAGLLGPGPFSSTAAGEEGSLRVEYDRFARYQAPEKLRAYLGPGMARDGKARMWLNRDFVEGVELIHIDPKPETVETAADRIIYTFVVADPNDVARMTWHFEGNRFGSIPVRIGLEDGPQLHFTQFFYP
jgi:hypothetical protein